MTSTKVTDAICFTDCWWVFGRIRCRNCPYIKVERGIVIIEHPKVRELERIVWEIIEI